ncbi:S-adenosyl-L-methionine-dependent methyltransferase [Trametes sanguinea]|nr:S-adenosyl-L-methionine-dependent methyltransferase [Trametes sanguinea]
MKRLSEEVAPSHFKKARSASDDRSWKKPTAEVYVEIPRRDKRLHVVTTYEAVGDEITEDHDLRVHGETPAEEDDGQVPVRTLNDFCVFEPETNALVPFEQLLTAEDPSSYRWVAVGVIGSYVEDPGESEGEEEDEDESIADDTGQRVLLSKIIECDAHYPTKHDGVFTVDPKVYLRTEYAWYIVLRPAASYARFYRHAWTCHRIVQTLLSAVTQELQTSAAEVVRAVNTPPPMEDISRPTFDALGVTVTEQELTANEMVQYLTFVLNGLYHQCPSLHKKFLRARLIQTIFRGRLVPDPPPPSCRKPATMPKDPEKRVLQHKNPTCVTPRVNAVAQKLFTQALRVTDMPTDSRQTPLEVRRRRVHHTDPTTIEWDESSVTIPDHYGRVIIDGETYSVGDIVIVEPGADEDQTRATNASTHSARCLDNELADTKWFCRISYMFEERDESGARRKRFHARWLQHGSQTLLQEAAHSRCLFWLDACDDLPFECIYSHCNVHPWRCGEPAPLDDEPGDANQFFIGPTWDPVKVAFIKRSSEQDEEALMKCKRGRPCISCGLLAIEEERQAWRTVSGDAIVWDSVAYHRRDFVYLRTPHDVLGIGQILRLITDGSGAVQQVEVRWYGRYDDVASRHCARRSVVPKDNRRLFQTGVVTLVPLEQITGKAYVASPLSAYEKEAFILEDDRFYCDLWAESLRPSSMDDLEVLPAEQLIKQCDLCMGAASEATLERDRLLEVFGPLRGLELFAGAGGLSTGMEMSGLIQTRWAVEFSPAAARTFRANHPDAIVYNQCSNKLLEHVIQEVHGHSPGPLKSLDKAECGHLPSLPLPGEVDFIYGGPPCQSFSLMNHHRRSDDIRSTLVCNMISYVEFYRPSYFLLENVVGLLSYKLSVDPEEGDSIKMGVVKFILSSLINLGYQVHFKVLQAGQHGAPQGRRRVIFLGARQDVPLPEFPLPQYAFPVPVHNVNLPTGEVLYPVTRQGADQVAHQCAPLACITVNEAINDLARFDWINPHIELPATKEDLKESKKRLAEGVDQFTACKSHSGGRLPGYTRPVAYAQPPLSRYQSWVRSGNGDTVLYHYTKWCASGVVERVVNIPIKPDADHEDLPSALRNERLYDEMGNTKMGYRGIYGRINGEEQFVTAMTTIAPNAKGGKVIHPNQKRILSVRECARAQGFPDKYRFLSSNEKVNDVIADQLRQIGNAVPVPLALALGKEIGKAACTLWREREREIQMAREQSPALDSEE